MNTPPRSNRAEEGGGFASPRLTLHIPNSYPRNISPHGSPKIGSPSVRSINLPIGGKDSPKIKDDNSLLIPSSHRLQSSISAPGALAAGDGNRNDDLLPAFAENDTQRNPIESIQWQASLKTIFKSRRTTAESARDFLARERTFFSWLRLSAWMAIGSAALFLRLQLRNLNQIIDHRSHGLNAGREINQMKYEGAFIQALRAQAMRKFVVQNQNVFAHSPIAIPFSTSTPPHIFRDRERNVLDTSIALSEALGILFFTLAIFSLIIGWIDYMRCVQALEHADEVVPILANQAANNTDDGHPNNVERRAIAQKYHDARHARQAHSTRIVYFTELIVAFFIFATALTILLTNNRASIAPELPSPIG